MKSVFKYIVEGSFFKHLYLHLFYSWRWYKLFNIVVPFIKINDKRIICDNFVGNGYGDNPKYISEALHNKDASFEIYFVIDDRKVNSTDLPSYIKPVKIYSLKYLYILASSKVWIMNYRKSVHILKRKKQIYIQTWHGNIGSKRSEAATESLLPPIYVKNAKKDSKQIDYCISGSKQLSTFYRNDFWYDGKVLEFGYPRNDVIFSEVVRKKLKKDLNIESLRVCMYAPTFRNNSSLDCYNIDYEALLSSLKAKFGGDWIIYLRLHPNLQNVKIGNLPKNVFNVTEYKDSQELLTISDCVITDYSSIIYDFMLSRKPAFIFATDLDNYQKNERSLYFPLESTPFPLCRSREELCSEIMSYDENHYLKKIDSFMSMVGSFDDGNASNRLADFIVNEIYGTK